MTTNISKETSDSTAAHQQKLMAAVQPEPPQGEEPKRECYKTRDDLTLAQQMAQIESKRANAAEQERDSARAEVTRLETEVIRQWQAADRVRAQVADLLTALADMKHDLDLFYAKYREPDNKYIKRLRAAIAAAEKGQK